MEDKTLNELQQIKIQDQIRDLKLQESKLKNKKRDAIGFIVQIFLFMFLVTMISDIPFIIAFMVKLFEKFSGIITDASSIDYSFTPMFFWYWAIGIGVLLIAFLILRISKLSKLLSQIKLDISKRYAKIKQLSEEMF